MSAKDHGLDLGAIVERRWKSRELKVVKDKLAAHLQAAKRIREAEPAPVLLENVRGSKVVANIIPTREALARSLGVHPDRFLAEISAVISGHAEASRRGAGIVKRPAVYGRRELSRAGIAQLPILTYYRCDGAPYLTAGVWVVRDPKHGVNLSYHRMMMTSATRGTVRVVERRGTDSALKGGGGTLDAAICIGAPAHVLFAAALSPGPDVDEYDLAARFGRLELARCKTVDLEVPASCELVIEGRFTGRQAPEGPFVDITGTVDIVRRQPVFEITRVSGRKDPLHYTIMPAGMDHRTLMGVPKELDIHREVGKVCRCLDVRITPGGSSWLHAVVRIAKRRSGDGRKALRAAFEGHRSLKHCVVVDKDVDISDPGAVEWAVSTRFQADRDLLNLKDRPSSSLDPSARHISGKGSVGAKMGLDATIRTGAYRKLFRRVRE